MFRFAPKSWLDLLCTLLVAVSLFGARESGAVETTSTWSQASILPATEVSRQTLNATLPDHVSQVLRTDKPINPGVLSDAIAVIVARPVGVLACLWKFPLPRSIDGLSVGASLVGIVELRL